MKIAELPQALRLASKLENLDAMIAQCVPDTDGEVRIVVRNCDPPVWLSCVDVLSFLHDQRDSIVVELAALGVTEQ
jgi:hypothetical protein